MLKDEKKKKERKRKRRRRRKRKRRGREDEDDDVEEDRGTWGNNEQDATAINFIILLLIKMNI
jgi:hypothetical protein